jgi:hypothetical protein
MKKYLLLGIAIGLVIAVGVGFGVGTVLAQGPTPTTPTVDQMKQMHESMHGIGTWDSMVQQMEQAFGKDWFNQMHGSNGIMNGAGMMNGANGQNHMGGGGMMGGGTNPPATK